MSELKKRSVLWLVIAIPAASVLMGIITLLVAFNGPNQAISVDAPPLNKTSWREAGPPEAPRP